MTKKLRPYQDQFITDIYASWNTGDKNVLAVLPTGAGKTVCFCKIAIVQASLGVPVAVMVHRKELVQQISLTLSSENITHNIISPRSVVKGIIAAQRRLYKKQFYDCNASITVISVDTLNSRIIKHERWAKNIKLWITD